MFLFIFNRYYFIDKIVIFKYISCSYLSERAVRKESENNLNTSHVLIYPVQTALTEIILMDLNTSHVLIYRGATYYLSDSALFKYISCSYLSSARRCCDNPLLRI